jgi:hypothetical protein
MEGEKVIKITSDLNAWKYDGWYKGRIGQEFSVLMYSITEAEYLVSVDDTFRKIPLSDCEIISDTSVEIK